MTNQTRDEQIMKSNAALRDCVEHELGAQIASIVIAEQEWRASDGLHMTGTWRATEMPVLIKLGINMNQLYWTQQMAAIAPDLVPLLYASGDHLGSQKIGWTVMERIAFSSLGPDWQGMSSRWH